MGRTPAAERAELLHEIAARLRARTDELAELMTREGGKPLLENRDEVGWTASVLRLLRRARPRASAGRVIPPVEATQLALVVKEPLGVVACIVPWNYPLLLLAWKLAPALAAGQRRACASRPSSRRCRRSCSRRRSPSFPPGVVSLLAGAGEVGAELVADERVDGIAFTGSVETGTPINARAARPPGAR